MQISERIQETLSHPLSFTGFLDSGIKFRLRAEPNKEGTELCIYFCIFSKI